MWRNAFVLTFVLVVVFRGLVFAENVTLTTYYPAPSGAYKAMRSHGLCVGTACTHALISDNNLSVQGNIGIGTTVPGYALQVGTGVSAHGLPDTGVLINGDLEVSGNFWGSGANLTGLAQGAAGELQYNDGAGNLAGAANFVFDQGANRVGIGSASPSQKVEIADAGHTALAITNTTAVNSPKVALGAGGFANFLEADDVGGLAIVLNPAANVGQANITAPLKSVQIKSIISGGVTRAVLGIGAGPHNWGTVLPANTALAVKNGGLYLEAGNALVNGNVGIGTTVPAARLDVAGGEVRVGSSGVACLAVNNGALRYTGTAYEFCNGTAWTAFGGGGTENRPTCTWRSTTDQSVDGETTIVGYCQLGEVMRGFGIRDNAGNCVNDLTGCTSKTADGGMKIYCCK